MASKKEKGILSEKMAAMVDTISRPFDPSQILEKPIAGGKKAKYVKSQWYIARLNEAFGLAWSLEIHNHFMVNNHIVMHVRVHYPNPDCPDNASCREFKDGIASHQLSSDVGNAFKSAYSKAFTIAASKVGSGLQLWGVETNADDDVDESPTFDNYNAGGPPVTTVNPGAHNPLPPVPGAGTAVPPPLPQAPQQYQGQGNPLPAPPVPQGYGAPQPQPQEGPQPPQFYNQGAGASALPPPPQVPQSAPPLPTGNPNPGGTTGYSSTLPDGSVTPASAAVGIQSSGAGDRVADFQINGIIAAAVTRGMADNPMQLVAQVLGPQFLQMDIHQLTQQQAQDVMDAVRRMPPQ